MPIHQEQSNPFVDPQGTLKLPTPEAEAENTVKIVLSRDMPDTVANHNPGCAFFILGPFMWILNRRNKLSQENDIDFQP